MSFHPHPFAPVSPVPHVRWQAGVLTPAAGGAPAWPLGAVPVPDSLRTAVARRQHTYAAGRIAARLALEAAGLPAPAPWVERGAGGAPVAPAGWRVSIGHTDRFCVAAAAPASAVEALGVDCEAPMSAEVAAQVRASVAPELALLPDDGHVSAEARLTLVFSAKECLYKALYPEVQRFFGMEAARCIRLDPATHSLELELADTLTPRWTAGTRVVAGWQEAHGHLVTWIVLPTRAPAP